MAEQIRPKMKDGIIKRGATYSYVVRERDPQTGRTKPRWVGGFKTIKEAKAARDKARSTSHDGTYVAPQNVTVAEWLTTWMKAHRATLKPSTAASYQAKIDAYLVPNLGTLKLQALGPARLSALWADLADRGGKNGRPLSPRSVEYTRAILRRACADAIVERLLSVNPVQGSKAPRRQRRDLLVWDDKQQAQFLTATKGSRWWIVWRLALATGMRRGEMCGLTWDAFDPDRATVTVSASSTQVDQEVVTTDTKSSEVRVVAIDKATVRAVKTWRKQQAAERLKAGEVWQDTGLMFTWQDGSRVLPDYLSKEFVKDVARVQKKMRTEKAKQIEQDIRAGSPGIDPDELAGRIDRELAKVGIGLPRLTLHGCRHSHACTLLRNGVPVHVVAARLGHADPALTHRVYAHAIPADGTAAAAVFAAALGAI